LPDFRLELGFQSKIMGIVNLTPDSFSRDGCLRRSADYTRCAVRLAEKFIREGADIIDIGGESTRPGSQPVTVKEELKRILPAITQVVKICKTPISVDTYKTIVAKHALDAGANIINNIKGVSPDRSLLRMVQHYGAAIVLMHMRGSPRTMQSKPFYRDCVKEIIVELRKSIEICLEIGIKSDKIIIDPGIGFGKTLEHNLEILNRLREFACLNRPILVGTSRKSLIGKVLGLDIQHRLLGTAATVCTSILNGAHIVRVHDVKQIKEIVTMTDAIMNQHI
jgi:dihydropteroate synthase